MLRQDLAGLPPQAGGGNRMRTKGYKCYNYHGKGRVWDSPLCGELGDVALSCQDRGVSHMTNADRRRAMSDEELAMAIVRESDNLPCGMCAPKMRTPDHCDGNCALTALKTGSSSQRRRIKLWASFLEGYLLVPPLCAMLLIVKRRWRKTYSRERAIT